MNRDWIELWLDRNDGARPEPLRVGYSPGTTVRELARALDNPGHHHEGHIALVGIEPPTGVLPADAPLERSGLRRGQVVTLAARIGHHRNWPVLPPPCWCDADPTEGGASPWAHRWWWGGPPTAACG